MQTVANCITIISRLISQLVFYLLPAACLHVLSLPGEINNSDLPIWNRDSFYFLSVDCGILVICQRIIALWVRDLMQNFVFEMFLILVKYIQCMMIVHDDASTSQ